MDIFEEFLGEAWAEYDLIAEPYAKVLRATGEKRAARIARARHSKARRIAAALARRARKKARREAVFSH
jgi:hypothetical protein